MCPSRREKNVVHLPLGMLLAINQRGQKLIHFENTILLEIFRFRKISMKRKYNVMSHTLKIQ